MPVPRDVYKRQLQHILCTDRMATMYILPDGTAQAAEEDEEEEE